jgi:hypothetical protein
MPHLQSIREPAGRTGKVAEVCFDIFSCGGSHSRNKRQGRRASIVQEWQDVRFFQPKRLLTENQTARPTLTMFGSYFTPGSNLCIINISCSWLLEFVFCRFYIYMVDG